MLNTKQASKLLRVSPSRIRQFVRANRLKPLYRTTRQLLFDEKEIQRFRAIRRRAGSPNKIKPVA